MKIKLILLALFAGLLLSACNSLKNPAATQNFKRVKYRAHLNLSKSQAKPSITAFETEQEEFVQNPVNPKDSLVWMRPSSLHSLNDLQHFALKTPLRASLKAEMRTHHLNINELKQKALNLSESIPAKTNVVLSDPWWEDDPEDWPWQQIVLAFILFLLIVLAIYLLISLLGGIVGSLLGLILLLLLIYVLLEYWS